MASAAPIIKEKGLVIINTGDGKGKSTAGFGMLVRAWGRGMKVGVVQFIKSDTGKYGEHMAFDKMGIEIIPSGRGFTWTSHDLDEDAEKARNGWKIASEMILSGEYDVLMLDEITYAVRYGWLDSSEIIDVLSRRPELMHVIITGRSAAPELLEFADLVSEVNLVKHPFREQGIRAQKGVEY